MQWPEFNGQIQANVPLSGLTTWQIGGAADWLLVPETFEDLKTLLDFLNKQGLRHLVLGNGSNILFSDQGYRGAIISLGHGFRNVIINNEEITAGAGILLQTLAKHAADNGLSGLEALSGIPGTVGAAAFINAGAYGQSLLSNCVEIQYFDADGVYRTITDIRPGYRSGGLPDDVIITELRLVLKPEMPERIYQLMHQYFERRWSTQPLNEKSAGCTFKNPLDSGAGRLIDELGLKGFQIGQALISEKHANFIVNCGDATASDVTLIIEHVRQIVFQTYDVKLELEVVILDEYGNRLDPGRIQQ